MKKTLALITIMILCWGCNVKKYKEDITFTIEKIGTAQALCGIYIDSYKDVWNKAIQDNTYEGKYCSDYNEAIAKHYKKIQELDTFQELSSDIQNIEKTIKGLKNYPSKYKDAYNELVEIFTDLNELYEYANYPKGSLLTYSSKTLDLYQNLSKKIKEFKIKYTDQ